MSRFAVLPESLHTTADGTITFFKNHYGMKSTKIESAIEDFESLAFRPSIQGTASDGSRFCIEVVEKLRLPPSVVEFLESCGQSSSPIKFILVIPTGAENGDAEYAKNLRLCRTKGVGVYVVDEKGNGSRHQGPLSQLAVAVSKVEVTKYPKSYRTDLQTQIETYHDGNPVKACQGVAEVLELLTRRVVKKAVKKRLMPKPKYKIDTHAWANVCEDLRDNLVRDTKKGKPTCCKPISERLLSRIHGFTEYRNHVSHKPKNSAERKKLEKNIRNYFEQACTLLLELIQASKSLKP